VSTPRDIAQRVEVVRRRDAFERDPAAFLDQWRGADARLRQKVLAARRKVANVEVPDAVRELAARLCLALGTDGLRGELTLLRAARALAAFEGEREVSTAMIHRVAPMSLRHRLRRDPMDEAGSGVRIERALAELSAGHRPVLEMGARA
jgi:magnesium chelatase subunit I